MIVVLRGQAGRRVGRPSGPSRRGGVHPRLFARVACYQQPVTVAASRSTARRVVSVEGTWLSRNENSFTWPSAPRVNPVNEITPVSEPVLAWMSPAAHLVGLVT